MWLWFSLVFPSLYVVQKYLGWGGTLAYALLAAGGVKLAPRFPIPRSQRAIARLAGVTLLAILVAFVSIYPIVNVHTPGFGSDDDDAYNVGARALVAGQSPYTHRTYLGNVLHQLPGAFVLAWPFVLLGTSAIQNLFWLTMFFLAVGVETRDSRIALRLAWLVLAFSPIVIHQVVTGTGHSANTIYVLLGLWWLMRTSHRDLAAVAWGIALASRANFLFLVPLAFGWLRQRDGWADALRAMLLTSMTVAALTLPFYLHDPLNFGPLEARDRLLRFDAWLPHGAAIMIATMLLLAVGLSFMPITHSTLFRNAAIVQAFPVIAGTLLGTLQTGRLDLAYATYGTFFTWFALMAFAAASGEAHQRAIVGRA
jgi:hypothetical protein